MTHAMTCPCAPQTSCRSRTSQPVSPPISAPRLPSMWVSQSYASHASDLPWPPQISWSSWLSSPWNQTPPTWALRSFSPQSPPVARMAWPSSVSLLMTSMLTTPNLTTRTRMTWTPFFARVCAPPASFHPSNPKIDDPGTTMIETRPFETSHSPNPTKLRSPQPPSRAKNPIPKQTDAPLVPIPKQNHQARAADLRCPDRSHSP